MSITEKLLTIAENEQNVYNAGYEKGKSEGGGGDVVDHTMYATTLAFGDLNLFGKPKVVIRCNALKGIGGLFNATVLNTTVEELEVFCEKTITSIESIAPAYLAKSENALKRLILHTDTSQCTSFNSFLWKQANIEEIGGTPLDFTSMTHTNLWLSGCSNLREIRVKENTIYKSISFSNSAVWSDESKQSIFDGLATVETAETLTLTKNVKILQSQVDSANNKGWTVAGGKVVSEEEYYA